MKTIITGCLLAAPCLAIAPQFADQSNTWDTYKVGKVIGDAQLAGDFTGMATGDFDGDLMQDAAFLIGANLTALFSPGLYDYTRQSTIQCNAIASIPINAEGTRQSILYAFADGPGLKVAEWTDTGWLISDVSGTGFPEVQSIRVYSGASGIYVAGLALDGLTVHAASTTDTFLSGSTTWTSEGSTTSLVSVSDFAYLDWNVTPKPELAIASGSFIHVHPTNLSSPTTLYTGVHIGFSVTQVERIQRDGLIRDVLAVLADAGSGGQVISVHAPTGIKSTTNITGIGDALKMVAADFDGNGRSDLIMTMQTSHDIGVLFASDHNMPTYALDDNYRLGQSYPAATRFHVQAPGVPGLLAATPGAMDIDNDGDMDFCVPTDADRSVWIYKDDTLVDHHALTPVLEVDDDNNGIHLLGDGHLAMIMDMPAQMTDSNGLPIADGIEVTYWEQSNLTSLVDFHSADVVTYDWDSIMVPSNPDGKHAIRYQVDNSSLPIPPGGTGSTFEPIVYMTLRQVQRGPGGELIGAYPAYVFMFHAAGASETEYFDYVANFPGAGNGNFDVIDAAPLPEDDDSDSGSDGGPGTSELQGDGSKDGSGHCVPCVPFGG